MSTRLNASLLAAHTAGDHWSLVSLYAEAAQAANDIDARCFYLTHAYVFALEQDHPDIPVLHRQLAAYNRV